MVDSTPSSDGVITKPRSKSVPQTIDALKLLMTDRGFTVFNVIDHRGVAERAGVQMPDSKLVTFGKLAFGAVVMGRGAARGVGHPSQGVGLGGRDGAVSVSYNNSPGFLTERHHLEGALRGPAGALRCS